MDERIAGYDTKMGKTLKNLESELGTIRAGRANPHVLDRITVDYYGAPTPLQQVANITVPEARMIQIQPWDGTLLKLIEKAILVSDLGIKGEAAKVAVRNIRRDANDAFKKLAKSDVSEDEIKELEDNIQKLTDKYIKEIDKSVEVKSKEIMTV